MGVVVGALMFIVGAAACGDDDGTSTSTSGSTTGSTTSSSTTTTTTTSTDGGGGGGGSSGEGGGGGGTGDAAAAVVLEAKSGSQATGTAVFTLGADGQVTLQVDVQGVTPPGKHGIHIHEHGDCSHEGGDSAGGHWNPYNKQHGAFGVGEFHLGDIGNIDIDEEGNGSLTLTTALWKLGDASLDDVVGRGLILHAGEDNLTPTPNPGARIACGAIELTQ